MTWKTSSKGHASGHQYSIYALISNCDWKLSYAKDGDLSWHTQTKQFLEKINSCIGEYVKIKLSFSFWYSLRGSSNPFAAIYDLY